MVSVPLPLGASDGLRYFIVALLGLFIYLLYSVDDYIHEPFLLFHHRVSIDSNVSVSIYMYSRS